MDDGRGPNQLSLTNYSSPFVKINWFIQCVFQVCQVNCIKKDKQHSFSVHSVENLNSLIAILLIGEAAWVVIKGQVWDYSDLKFPSLPSSSVASSKFLPFSVLQFPYQQNENNQ